MKAMRVLAAAGLALVALAAASLPGCATDPSAPADAQAAADCITREPPIGSNVPRAMRCPGSSAASGLERDAQRDQAERIRDDQNRRNLPRPSAGPGG
ncbi:MAG: hypothetical protein JNN18_14720 [Rubrivivax sp.]|nr:hypothetical protein [Rubrivivax sp.]